MTQNEMRNYYEVLEVSTTARADEIYHSYMRAKQAYSTDSLALYSLMSPDECRNIVEMIEEAYAILSDPQKRKRYDEVRGLNMGFQENDYLALSNRVSPIRSGYSQTQRNLYDHIERTTPQLQSQPVNVSVPASHATVNNHVTPITSAPSVSSSVPGQTSMQKIVAQKRFSLDYNIDPEFEIEIEKMDEFTGDFLKKIREYKGVDLERLSDMTKVSKMNLQYLENEEFAKLPAAVYVRGFVFQYAKCLKLSADKVANSYIARMKKLHS